MATHVFRTNPLLRLLARSLAVALLGRKAGVATGQAPILPFLPSFLPSCLAPDRATTGSKGCSS